MYLIIITLPLFAFLIAGLAGRKIGKTGVQIITSVSITIAAILSIIGLYEMQINDFGYNDMEPRALSGPDGAPIAHYSADIWSRAAGNRLNIIMPWIESEIILINWAFKFDTITLIMCVVILSISSLVHIYSIGYMSEDPHNQRFFSYLSLFTFFMLILVCSDNYLLMFVGWEGV